MAADDRPKVSATSLSPAASIDRRTVLLVLALTILAFGLRFYRLSNQSLWIDEVYSVITAKVPLEQVYSYSTQFSNSLPTYFVMLRAILPEGNRDVEWSARFLSAVAGALSIPVFIGVVFFWRRRLGVALLAGLLLAVNPLHIWYSQEARAYALMLFFGLLAMLFLELARDSRWSEWRTFYVLSALAAVALHRTALVFPGLCIFWHAQDLLRQHKSAALALRQLLVHLPIGIGALLVMIVKLNPTPEGYHRAGSILQFGYSFMTFVGGYSFGPSLGEIQNSGPKAALAANWFQVAVLLLVCAMLVWAWGLNWRQYVFTRETALVVVGIGTVAAYSAVSRFDYNVRYVLPALFGFLALIAALVASLPARAQVARLATLAVLAVSLYADAQWFWSPRYRKPDARAVANWLVDNKSRVKSWTMLPEYLSLPLHWYLSELDQDMLKRAVTPAGNLTFSPLPDVLMLQRRDQLSELEKKLVGSYCLLAGAVQTNRSFTGFELYLGAPR